MILTFKDFIANIDFSFLLLTYSTDIFKKFIRFFSFKEYKIISNNSLFILIEFIRAARWKSLSKRNSWSERFITKTEIDIVILSMPIRTVSYISKKRARSLMTFIIIILIFWCTGSWVTSVNRLNMQLTSALLSNIALILIFLIITFTIEQTTAYMRRKKVTRITISFKCTDFVELSFIESRCTFFFLMSFDYAMNFFLIFLLSLRRWCCETSVWIIRKRYQAIRECGFR